MAAVRAKCDECGDVQMHTRDLTVRYCADTALATYVFRCPECRLITARDAEQNVVDKLVEAGVKLKVWRMPAELREARPIGEPLSHEDLLAFHEILFADTRDSWMTRLTEHP